MSSSWWIPSPDGAQLAFPAVRLGPVLGWPVGGEWVTVMYYYVRWRLLPHSIHLGRAQHRTQFGGKRNRKTGSGADAGLRYSCQSESGGSSPLPCYPCETGHVCRTRVYPRGLQLQQQARAPWWQYWPPPAWWPLYLEPLQRKEDPTTAKWAWSIGIHIS